MLLVGAGGDFIHQAVGPSLCIGERTTANQLCRHVCIPIGVKVVTVVVESDLDTVSANLVVLVMQWLCEIANDVHEESEGFGGIVSTKSAVACALGVIGNGRD